MPKKQHRELAKIRRFDQLIAFLRDEMDWPIGSTDFEDLVFEYTANELGIEAKSAAKIQEIKRLRPLSTNQPWGIFFVKFEPKRLPVVALRRILGQVALKKRSSANKAERQAWATDDLLFISNYGEGEDRQISFAHFSQDEDKKDLPTLRVLGWDNLDTPLHLNHVADQLTERLAWPEDDSNSEVWRTTWRSAFTLRHREVVETSRELSERLAALARAIRDRIQTALAIESESGPLTKLMKAFQTSLVHDLDGDDFSDMYAQTIAYGLLSARIADPKKKTADDFAAHMRTNPFLRELMETFLHVGGRKGKAGGPGIDFDELGVSDVVDLLDRANMEAVIRDFGDEKPEEDPVIHFYELFLQKYDAQMRMQRGVFYTPRPVVSFIVRSIDETLRQRFGLRDGLADTSTWQQLADQHRAIQIPPGTNPNNKFVQILDPATGTGTFLVEAIEVMHTTMKEKWAGQGHGKGQQAKLWNSYVAQDLLPRLHGFELMMAPYAIAHMKIGLKLYETGYDFGTDERAQIYLTNSLEPADDFYGKFDFVIPALANEAKAVNDVKQNLPFTVIFGNPPYASISANMTDWIHGRVNDYLYIDGARIEEKSKRNHLQNDYIKFMRIAAISCERSNYATFGYITSNSYLDGRTLRGLRWNLMQTFQDIRILNLWGDSNKRNAIASDKNVFDITEGVAICIATRFGTSTDGKVSYSEIQGPREDKYRALMSELGGIRWHPISASSPNYLFADIDDSRQVEFELLGPSLSSVFSVHGAGMKSNRDKFATDEDPNALLDRIREFADRSVSDSDLRARYQLKDNYTWKLPKIRAGFDASSVSEDKIVPLSYRPFDNRYVYYDKAIVFNPRVQIMRHLIKEGNLALASIGQNESTTFNHVFVSRGPVEIKMSTHYGASVVFPLFLHGGKDYSDLFSEGDDARSNLTTHAQNLISLGKRCRNVSEKSNDKKAFYYIYAVLHSNDYRSRYAEQFLTDFPRIPDQPPQSLFDELCSFGCTLVALHLLDAEFDGASWNNRDQEIDCPFDKEEFPFSSGGSSQVEKASFSDNTVWIDKAKQSGFHDVPEAVWMFRIGGYQVCEKWLKDRQAKGGKNPRPGQILGEDHINYYRKILVAISETIRITSEIDRAIKNHGGWPDAFQAEATRAVSVENSGDQDLRKVAEDEAPYDGTTE